MAMRAWLGCPWFRLICTHSQCCLKILGCRFACDKQRAMYGGLRCAVACLDLLVPLPCSTYLKHDGLKGDAAQPLGQTTP